MDMVDDRKIAFNPAVELSYLSPDEQTNLLDAMESEQATPSLSQAQRLKRFSQEGNLTLDMMRVIMSEEKKPVEDKKLTFEESELNDMFPKSFPRDKRKTLIKKLVAKWVRSYMQEQSR